MNTVGERILCEGKHVGHANAVVEERVSCNTRMKPGIVPSLFFMPDMIAARKLAEVRCEHRLPGGELTHSLLSERARPYLTSPESIMKVLQHGHKCGLPAFDPVTNEERQCSERCRCLSSSS